MNPFNLQSQTGVVHDLTKVFAPFDVSGDPCRFVMPDIRLQIHEDRCFGPDDWLDLGELILRPPRPDVPDAEFNPKVLSELIKQAVRLGYYEWKVIAFDTLLKQAVDFIQKQSSTKKDLEERQKNSIRRGLEAVAHVAIRCGLCHPVFDPKVIMDMPFRRPVTLVVDTSAVYQGALDFAVRFLHPMARFKVPAIVHMEIISHVNSYLNYRRGQGKVTPLHKVLSEHSQALGGQRTLLRLELESSAAVERPRLGADPLRQIAFPSADQEDKDFGIEKIHRSFADRLIFETALQHQERLHPGHAVAVLTSDEGLARMSLAEGVSALFFRAVTSNVVFGSTLTGVCFQPFAEPESLGRRLVSIPLAKLLWELAVTFGAARIWNQRKEAAVQIHAIGEEFAWQPCHANEDLLWVNIIPPKTQPYTGQVRITETSESGKLSPHESIAHSAQPSYYRFRLESLVALLSELAVRETMNEATGMQITQLQTPRRYHEYIEYLSSGGFIEPVEEAVRLTEVGRELWAALEKTEPPAIHQLLCRTPSYKNFLKKLEVGKPTRPEDASEVAKSAFRNYCDLAALAGSALLVAEDGAYATPVQPEVAEFSRLALKCYHALRRENEFVLTGRWLEAMSKEHGIHPFSTRRLLEQAWQEGLLERFVEGSTPETRYGKHALPSLELHEGILAVNRIPLYEGTFLIPGRASVLLRLEVKKQ